jgi:ribonuclease P protein component
MANTRLTQRKQFLYVANGAYMAKRSLVVQARQSSSAHSSIRSGFTATKKTGNAVRRNRAKRRLREASRILLEQYGQTGWDYVFIARKETTDTNWLTLLDDMKLALLNLGNHRKGIIDKRQSLPNQTRNKS